MADDTYVQAIRYEADIADVQHKLDALAAKQDDTETKTKTATGKMSQHWDSVKGSVTAIVTGIGLLGGAAILMAPKVLEGGAGLEALDKKASTVFGGSLGMVNNWASSNAKAMGLTNSGARDAAAAMADLLKPMGFTASQAADMSTKMLDVSGALSAWTGGSRSAKEVSDILAKAMLGERDGLKELGVSISEADVQARLAQNGQAGLTGAALEQAKAVATQQLILEKSADAQKAWADGSMDAVKKQNSMKASVEQVKESFTKALYPALAGILPVVTSVASWLGDHLPAAIATLRAWVTGAAQWIGAHKTLMIGVAVVIGGVLVAAFVAWAVAAGTAAVATITAAAPVIAIGLAVGALAAGVIYAYNHFAIFRETVNTVKDVLVTVWGFITDDLIPIISTLIDLWLLPLKVSFEAIKTVINDVVIVAFQAVFDFITTYVIPIFASIASTIVSVGTTVGTIVGNIVGFITGMPGKIASTVAGLWSGITGGISTAKDWVSGRIDDIVTFVVNLPSRVASGVAGVFDGIKDAISAAKDWVSGSLDGVVTMATGLPGRLVGVFSGMWDGIKSAFKSAINWVIGGWNSLEFTLPSVDTHIPGVGKIGGWSIGTPNIPLLMHSGGTVPGPRGAEVLALLRVGETVRTERQEASLGRTSGPTIVNHGPVTFVTSGNARQWSNEMLWRLAG